MSRLARRLGASLLATLAIAAGCRKGGPAAGESESPVTFEAAIGNRTSSSHETRASTPTTKKGTRTTSTGAKSADWAEGDVIGVFMVAHGGTAADHSLARNVPYRHTGGGGFAVASGSDPLLYPRAGSVDFVACYPWRPLSSDVYTIDVGGECDPGATDFMYSDNAAGHSSGQVPLLRFNHRLSKLVFNVVDATGGSLDALEATVSGALTRAGFNLSTGVLAVDGNSVAPIVAATVADGDGERATARVEAIVVPCPAVAPTVDFTLADGSTARLTLTHSTWEEGNIYLYNVRITDGGRVELADGAVIFDWDDRDLAPDDYEIDKQKPGDGENPDPVDPDGPDDPDDPDDGPELYFAEGFGQGGTSEGVSVGIYSGWENPSPVHFAERFGGGGIGAEGDGSRVCRAEGLGTHIRFPPGANADFSITGLATMRSEITLSYDVAAGRGGTSAALVRVYADGENLTPQISALIPSPNTYKSVTVAVPSGATSLRFVVDGASNPHGMRLDNVRLKGRKR